MSGYLDWQVGDRVVCVDDGFVNGTGVTVPRNGSVYTLRSIVADEDGVFVRLVEIQNKPRPGYVLECDFEAASFRKVQPRKTNIAIFERLLNVADAPIREEA